MSGPLTGSGMQDFTFQVEILRTPEAWRLGVDLIVGKGSNDGSLLMVERVNKGGLIEEWNSRSEAPYQVQGGDIIISANGVQGDIVAMSNLLRTAQDTLHITVLRRASLPKAQAPKASGPHEAEFAGMLESAVGQMARFGEGDGLMNLDQMELRNAYAGLGSQPAMPAQVSHMGPEGFTFEVVLRKPAGAFLGIDMLPAPKKPCLIVKQVIQGGVVAAWNLQCKGSAFAIQSGDYIVRVNDVTDGITAFMEEMRARSELHLTVLRRTDAPDANRIQNLAAGRSALGAPGASQMMGHLPRPPPFKGAGRALSGYEAMDLRQPWREEARVESTPLSEDFTFEVEIEKPRGHKMGIDVMLMTGGGRCGLLVGQVAVGGYAHLWNQRSQWPRQILKNDLIIAANGISAWTDLPRMAQEFDVDICRVRFTVQRCPTPIRPVNRPQAPQAQVQDLDSWWPHAQNSVPSGPNVAPGNWVKPLATLPVLQDRSGGDVPYTHGGCGGLALGLAVEEDIGMPPGLASRSMGLGKQADGFLDPQTIPMPSMVTASSNKIRASEAAQVPFSLGGGAPSEEASAWMKKAEEKQAVEREAHAAATATALAAAVVEDEAEAKTQSKLPPAKLLLCTLQLNDEDLTTVLQEALAQRPWLTAPVKQAIMEHATQ